MENLPKAAESFGGHTWRVEGGGKGAWSYSKVYKNIFFFFELGFLWYE